MVGGTGCWGTRGTVNGPIDVPARDAVERPNQPTRGFCAERPRFPPAPCPVNMSLTGFRPGVAQICLELIAWRTPIAARAASEWRTHCGETGLSMPARLAAVAASLCRPLVV